MPYEKQKAESFEGFGGINTKVSNYITGLHECLDLQNFDFSRPGAWSTRWGTTSFIGSTNSGQSSRVLGVFEFEKLDGASHIFENFNNGMWFGQGQTLYSTNIGTTYIFFGATFFQLWLSGEGVTYYAYSQVGSTYYTAGLGSSPIIPTFDSNLFDYKPFVNTLFFSNGSSGSFQKYIGESLWASQAAGGSLFYKTLVNFSYLYGLPPGSSSVGFSVVSGMGNIGATGLFQFGYGWLDLLGYQSAPINASPFSYPTNTGVSLSGASNSVIAIYLSTSLIPWDYGVTAISLYLSNSSGSQLFQYVQSPFSGGANDSNGNLSLSRAVNPNGLTQLLFPSGNTNLDMGIRGAVAQYATLAFTIWPGQNYTSASGIITNTTVSLGKPAQYPLFFTLSPKYLEIYNNQIYMAGFTTYPADTSFPSTNIAPSNYQSRLYWSDVGNSEYVDPTFFAEVRTNDSDRITGLKNYQGNMMIFKKRSFHTLFANSATDISIQQNSDQYGCLSHRCAITYNQQLLFLDRKGIIRWDGANISVASDKIEPIFARMNIDAATDNAVGIHFKKRNEVWFGIPVDGATLNNLTIVYDYIADAWTTLNGFVPSYFTIAKGALSDYTCLYGSYTGAVFNFGSSLPSDNGTAITAIATSLFYRDMGNTVEKQWRRLFVDANIMSSGSTLQIDMIPDHGTSIYATRYMAMGTFQNRIDFGIPAKSLQFKFTYASATLPININGITPESRYQRSV